MAGLFPPANSIPHLPHKNATSMRYHPQEMSEFASKLHFCDEDGELN
jgi:hypothetical protein